MSAPAAYEPPQSHGTPRDTLGIDLDSIPARVLQAVRIGFGIAGGAALALGIALLVWPDRTLAVGAALLAINFLIIGVVRLAIGVFGTAYSSGMRVLAIVMGLLLVIGGIVILRNLTASATALVLIVTITVGISWIIEGVTTLVDADRARSRGWAIASGVIAILAGIAVVSAPGWTAMVLLTFAGIALILLGAVGLIRAFTLGRGRTA